MNVENFIIDILHYSQQEPEALNSCYQVEPGNEGGSTWKLLQVVQSS
ncbi:MAG: hypothetical protein HXY43_23835 [Fischerella sp.]|jgi:hypothetical protein|nr:hypothetical protein [Fischerella sp.]NWF62201.1 hypothetical protein [Fischerella sp.]